MVFHSETLKAGFYYHLDLNLDMTRCYYLSGEKKGNKWIYFGDSDGWIKEPEWWALLWTCIPHEDELNDLEYSETNPTDFKLN